MFFGLYDFNAQVGYTKVFAEKILDFFDKYM
jgi:hypothetical protein